MAVICLLLGTIGWNWLAYKLWARARKHSLWLELPALGFFIHNLVAPIASWTSFFHENGDPDSFFGLFANPIYGILMLALTIELSGVAFAARVIAKLGDVEETWMQWCMFVFAFACVLLSIVMAVAHIRSGEFIGRIHM